MGSVFSKPKMPQKSEEQIAAEKAAKEQAKKEHRSINSEIQLAIISYVKHLEKKNEKTT